MRRALACASYCFSLCLAGACFPHELEWRISFSDETLETRIVKIEAKVLRGGCAGTEVVVERTADLGADLTLSELEPGTYGFSARVADSECFWYGAGCAEATLPADTVSVELVPIAPERACDASLRESCLDGECVVPALDPPMPCSPGHAACAGECVRLDTAASCGRCGPACSMGPEGVASGTCQRNANGTHECVTICNAGGILQCTDLQSDVLNCGEDGRACERQENTRAFCDLGMCRYQCVAGFTPIEGDAANGCEME
jgi:hypothetical protein